MRHQPLTKKGTIGQPCIKKALPINQKSFYMLYKNRFSFQLIFPSDIVGKLDLAP